MARHQPAPATNPVSAAPSSWVALGLVGLVGVLIGATGTYWLLLPRLRQAPPAPMGTPVAAADPLAHDPPANLTTGMAPAQAERARGNFYYDHQNWSKAISCYEAAIRQGSDDADIRTDLGNAYRFSHRADEALAQYRHAQQMNPSHEFSLFNQGGLYLEEMRDPQKAVEAWREYLRRFPQGRNVVAAQQLIAQAGTGLALPVNASRPPSNTAPNPADVEKLLQLVPPAQTRP